MKVKWQMKVFFFTFDYGNCTLNASLTIGNKKANFQRLSNDIIVDRKLAEIITLQIRHRRRIELLPKLEFSSLTIIDPKQFMNSRIYTRTSFAQISE